MKIYGKTKIKDYDSLEETQNIKAETELDVEEEENNESSNKKMILLIGGAILLVIIVIIIFFIFRSGNKTNEQRTIDNKIIQPIPLFQKNQSLAQSKVNEMNQQNNGTNRQNIGVNQQNNGTNRQNIGVNQQNNGTNQQQNLFGNQHLPQKETIHQVYEIKKPLNLNISKHKQFFPSLSINQKSNVTNISDLFKSKTLFINDKKLTYNYIHFIRQNDKDEEKYKKELVERVEFNGIVGQKKGQINLPDFYKLCNKKKIYYLKDFKASDNPDISIIIPMYNTNIDIVKTIRSIQNQSFKTYEIIIVDDKSTYRKELYKSLFESEPRLRIFTHLKNIGTWRKRLDGFLYSRGQYILHLNPGDILADNYVLEDAFNLVTRYSLDTVRFSFSKTIYNKNFNDNMVFGRMKIYPQKHTKIIYGRPDYNVHEFGYGTVWNRLVRNNMFTKGLDLVDEFIINANKDLWEDMWWNDLIDRVSFSNLVVNRLGYIFLYERENAFEPRIRFKFQRDKTIKEFILFWFFDYQLLDKENDKKLTLDTLYNYNKKNNTFCRLPMRLEFLTSKFDMYERLLKLLMSDSYVSEKDKKFVKELYSSYTKMFKKKKKPKIKINKTISSTSKIRKKTNSTSNIIKNDTNKNITSNISKKKNRNSHENATKARNETKDEITKNGKEKKISNETKNVNETKSSNETKNINKIKSNKETKNVNETKSSNETTKNENITKARNETTTNETNKNENATKSGNETSKERTQNGNVTKSSNETIKDTTKNGNTTKSDNETLKDTTENENATKTSNETINETNKNNDVLGMNQTKSSTINKSGKRRLRM